MSKKQQQWSFEAWLAPNGQINLFSLNGGQVEAMLGRYEADEQHHFFSHVERFVSDIRSVHQSWQEWGGGIDDKETLRQYYDACCRDGQRFFQSTPSGGALRWWNKEHNAAVHPASAQRQGALQ